MDRAVSLDPLAPGEIGRLRALIVDAFARSLVEERGLMPDAARADAEAEYDKEVAAMRPAPASGLFDIVDGEAGRCGFLWLVARDRPAPVTRHLLFITIFAPLRRAGRAEAAMVEVERRARAAGVDALTLHVFESNVAARNLYRKLGFARYPRGLVKWLGAPPG